MFIHAFLLAFGLVFLAGDGLFGAADSFLDAGGDAHGFLLKGLSANASMLLVFR